MPTPTLAESPLQGIRVLWERKSPHKEFVAALEVSPDGHWLISASESHGENLLALTNVLEERVAGVVNMGRCRVTSLTWVTSGVFLVGCSNTSVYWAQLLIGDVSGSARFNF